MEAEGINLGLAFIAGVASFLSPCVLSLVPAYITYLGGRSAASAQGQRPDRWVTLSHALAFVLGFSLVFATLGLATSALGDLFYDARPWLARIGGVVVVIFGIHMTGLVRIPFLEYDLRPQALPDRKWGYLSSLLMGVFFSAGWSPCVGPILGLIMTIAFNGGSVIWGVGLLLVYSAGLAIPFLVAATQISLVTTVIRRYGKVMRYIEIVMGVLLVVLGVLLAVGQFEQQMARLAAFSYFDPMAEVSIGLYLLLGILAAALAGLIPAFVARSKGHDFVNWWFFGAGLFPVALVWVLLLKPASEKPLAEKPRPAEGGTE